jgi:hypothetical protein
VNLTGVTKMSICARNFARLGICPYNFTLKQSSNYRKEQETQNLAGIAYALCQIAEALIEHWIGNEKFGIIRK